MMKDVLDIPRTAMEVFETLPEGTACEVINNTLYMSPSPTTNHQDILLELATELRNFAKKYGLGKVYIAPCDVYLDNGNSVVQPDILFVRTGRENIIEQKGVYGAPDFVIEILSSNKSYDRQLKLELYRENGVAEYIIVDPESKDIWSYSLDNGTYNERLLNAGKLRIDTINFDLDF